MSVHLRIGTRPSALALAQVEEIKKRLPDIIFDIIPIETKGDKDKLTPLAFRENSDFFTYEIEQALLSGQIDVAVHSAKDLEDDSSIELLIIALTKSISPNDCLVSRNNLNLDDLPRASTIGTSSKNRKVSLLRYRNDLVAKDIRGNIDERLDKLDRGEFDAVIMACAALIRLGYEERITQIIPEHIIKPHPFQGRLAIQALRARKNLQEVFKEINEK